MATSDGKRVLVVLGSKSDLPAIQDMPRVFNKYGIPDSAVRYEVASVHRSLDKVRDLAKQATGQGYNAIIGVAGMAAALPGILAAETELPTIGVPLSPNDKYDDFNGVDSLLTCIRSPPGTPNATVPVNKAGVAAGAAAYLITGGYDAVAVGYTQFFNKQLAENAVSLLKEVGVSEAFIVDMRDGWVPAGGELPIVIHDFKHGNTTTNFKEYFSFYLAVPNVIPLSISPDSSLDGMSPIENCVWFGSNRYDTSALFAAEVVAQNADNGAEIIEKLRARKAKAAADIAKIRLVARDGKVVEEKA